MKDESNTAPSISSTKLALTVKGLRSQVRSIDYLQSDPIAVIGMGCRFPGGCSTPDEFWSLLDQGIDAIREVPADRWDVDAYYDPDPSVPGKMRTRWGGFLDRIDLFDYEHFGIAPREAVTMDPQHRLLLEVTWEALDDAGYTPDRIAGSQTGVWAAVYNSDYAQLQYRNLSSIDAHTSSGTAHSIAAGRISYLLDLRGPCMTVDTACSSSLVAVHLACQSLRNQDCRVALAGGVSLVLTPEQTISMSKWGMLAADGRCKTFDARADGFVRGEGCGVVVLKRMSDALEDGDRIHALIRGSAVNHDGRSNALTAPNGLSQQDLLRKALANARIAPSQLSYVEAHGTGTKVGDPIEVEALREVVGQPRPDGGRCVLGSVKTNIGHLEAAAGIAGLIKVILSLQHERIPPHLHFRKLNPLISLDGTCFVIPVEGRTWSAEGNTRFAGVSSLGFSGTNAHVIIEEAPRIVAVEDAAVYHPQTALLMPLSARTPEGLEALARAYDGFLDLNGRGSRMALNDICYSAGALRAHHPVRAAFVGNSHEELRRQLHGFLAQAKYADSGRLTYRSRNRNRLTFVYSGQCSEWGDVGRDLLEKEPVFRNAILDCADVVARNVGWSILEKLSSQDPGGPAQPEVVQPLLFAVQTAITALLASWGIVPDAVAGYGLGEVAAAYASGALDMEQALQVVLNRSRLMQRASGTGTMALVGLDYERARQSVERVGGSISIAAVDSPKSVTVSGEKADLGRFISACEQQGIDCRVLPVNGNFHGHLMASFQGEILESLRGLTPRPGSIPIFSTVTGSGVDGLSLDGAYWARNMVEPVLFDAAIGAMLEQDYNVFLDMSPHSVLSGAVVECARQSGRKATVVASVRPGLPERESLLWSLGHLYKLGFNVRWSGLYSSKGRCVSLPPYPWLRQPCWIEVPTQKPSIETRQTEASSHPLLGRRIQSPLLSGVGFESEIGAERPHFLGDHRVGGKTVFPGAAFIEMAMSAGLELAGCRSRQSRLGDIHRSVPQIVIEGMSIRDALLLPDNGSSQVQTGLTPDGSDSAAFQIFSCPSEVDCRSQNWVKHVGGRIRWSFDRSSTGGVPTSGPSLSEARARCTEQVDPGQQHALLQEAGIVFGPAFQCIDGLWRGASEAIGLIRAADSIAADAGWYAFHPALLDSCLRVFSAILTCTGESYGTSRLYVPVGVGRMMLDRLPGDTLWSYVKLRKPSIASASMASGDVVVFDERGGIVASLHDVGLKATTPERLLQADAKASRVQLYHICWEPQPSERPTSAATDDAQVLWLILSDRSGMGTLLRTRLESVGSKCIEVYAGNGFRSDGGDRFDVDPGNPADFKRMVAESLAGRSGDRWGIIYLWGLDSLASDGGSDSPLEAQRLSCGGLLHLIQAIPVENGQSYPRLWVVTRGAMDAGGAKTIDPRQAPLWGLGSVLALERPDLGCVRIDLDPAGRIESDIEAIYNEIQSGSIGENQVAFRDGVRDVARLVDLESEAQPVRGPSFFSKSQELRAADSGLIEDLSFHPVPRRPPGRGEIEIEVEAVGLNFRDVLNALKMLPGMETPLGGECAGRVVAVGEAVQGFHPGDEVLAFAIGSFRSFVTIPAQFAFRKPEKLTFEEAASIPVVFLTAHYGLRHLAKLAAGERVLIHAASGGVGLAAVQIAQRVGAEIFATAGNPEKRQFLSSLGVPHVMDSRSPGFADEILAETGGEGIDVVLNSLAGEMIPKSLSLVRKGGRFLEIGKRDIWDEVQVAQFKSGISYWPFDLGQVAQADPGLFEAMLSAVMSEFRAGGLKTIQLTVFGGREMADAFQTMARAKHIGKIVISLAGADSGPEKSTVPIVRPGGTYLITGGLGALGLEVSRWLCDRGARHIVLVGRRRPTEAAAGVLENMRQQGARVSVMSADLAQRPQLDQVLSEIRREMPPLCGVVHAAGVIDDGMLQNQDWERFVKVMAPKIDGAWNLHLSTEEMPLDFFVLFSSAASILGWQGQGAYAAGNAFLDALAHYRRRRGLTALSINWGPWAETGMAAGLESLQKRRMEAKGLQPIGSADALLAFQRMLTAEVPQIVALRADWPKFFGEQAEGVGRRFFSEIGAWRSVRQQPQPAPEKDSDFLGKLSRVPAGERRDLLADHIERQAGSVLGIARGKRIDRHQALHEIGLDSLMAVEMRNLLCRLLGCTLSPTLLFDYPTIEALVDYLADQVLKLEVDSEASPEIPRSEGSLDADIAYLQSISDADAEALLLEELKRLPKDD